jgi:hypothetical protein
MSLKRNILLQILLFLYEKIAQNRLEAPKKITTIATIWEGLRFFLLSHFEYLQIWLKYTYG